MKIWHKIIIATALVGGVAVGARNCTGTSPVEQLKKDRPEYLKKELQKEIIEQRRVDLLDDLIEFSYKAKGALQTCYTMPDGFSQEPFALWVETEKNGRGEVKAYLVNHKTGSRYVIMENDRIKRNGQASPDDLEKKLEDAKNNFRDSLQWFYETIRELYE